MVIAVRKHRGWAVGMALAAMVGSGVTAPPARAAGCLPTGLVAAATPQARSGATNIFIDGSLSMAGYVAADARDLRPIGDLISILGSPSAASPNARFFAFGARITPLAGQDAASAYARPEGYACAKCDNKESRIDAVLNEIAHAPRGDLDVVVTDLWLDNRSMVGSPAVALGLPLRTILASGRAVGVLGVRAPFTGPIYDFPSKAVWTRARERPLFVLLIGPQARVEAARRALLGAGSPAFAPDRVQSTVFSTEVSPAVLSADQLRPTGGGVARSARVKPELVPGIRQFVIKTDLARRQRGAISGVFDGLASQRDGGVWTGGLRQTARVWRLHDPGMFGAVTCDRDTWTEIRALQGAWTSLPEGRAAFTISPANVADLETGHAYFVRASLGVAKLKIPNAGDAWLRSPEWSFRPDQEGEVRRRAPAFFPSLNVAEIASAMESALDLAAPNGVETGRLQFIISVDP